MRAIGGVLLTLAGAILVGFGVLLLLYNGYSEESGGNELVTWPYALVAFAVGAVCLFGSYRMLWRRSE
jgi:hypothetical protein